MANQDQIQKFWSEKEEALGGKVLFQTYVTFIGEAGSNVLNGRGGLFYIVGNRLYFEDFERHNALMALFNRKDDDYEKTEFSFLLEDILSVDRVSEGDARACVSGNLDEDRLSPLGKFKSFFIKGDWKISVKGRSSLFFEILDDKDLFKFLPSMKS